MELQWNTDGTVSIAPPKRPKKLTATRLATVLGLNQWATPFQAWCDITKAVDIPFEDTKYTLAGKTIEPKQIAYMREVYGMDDLVTPTDEFGKDYFSRTWGNFFDHPVLGGMWDSILKDEDGTVTGVLEFKTTKRAQDWLDKDKNVEPPEYYALQAAMYAYLLNTDYVIMVVSFLEEMDYDDPESYELNVENTATFEFNLSERYPNFEDDYIKPALAWWERHVETGDSPTFDEKSDSEYLAKMRSTSLNPDTDIDALLKELYETQNRIDVIESTMEADAKRVKNLKEQLKKYARENIGDKDTCIFSGSGVTCKLAKTTSMKLDEASMKKDGVYEKYVKETESNRFTVTFDKESK